ncbi:MAG: cadherin-like domain-containing protein [Acidobacteriota bacterium]|nr:cadherin-like domain-containing protein [Acidobacteriota bacterium]
MLAAVTAAVVVMAVTVTGVPVDHVSANDGSVWVVKDTDPGQFGQFNVPIRQLTRFVPANATTQTAYLLDVLQEGTTVLAVDELSRKVFPIDVVTGAADPAHGVAYGPGGRVALGGGVVALLQPQPGKPAGIWAESLGGSPVADLSGLNPVTAKPAATLAGAEAVAVDAAGDVFAASPNALVEVPYLNGRFAPPKVTAYANGPISRGSIALATVGTVPVVMDTTPSKPVIILPLGGRATTLDPVTASGSGPSFALQQSGPASASVLVASPDKLLAVPLGGGVPQALASVPGGGRTPAQPVELDACGYGAWSGDPGYRVEACPGQPPTVDPLNDALNHSTVVTDPVYRINNGQILLNDDATGQAWTVKGSPAQVLQTKDWQRVIQGLTAQASNNSSNQSAASQTAHRNPPELNNPVLYARAGVQSTLHVLDQDRDPGGSILSVLNVTASGPGFSAAVSPDNQSVILTLAPDASAPVTFTYEVIDGFGLTKSGPVTVQPTHDEHAPVPPATPAPPRHVVAGATVSLQVLGNWRDPENDALTVASASVPANDGTVSWTSDGLLTYSAPGDTTTDRPVNITYEVTDGRSPAVSAEQALVILGRGDLTPYPPTAVPDAVKVAVGRPAGFAPLANDVFGADPIHPGATLGLAGPVAGAAGLSVSTNISTGTLTLTATVAGTYSLDYQASYGSGVSPATQILVEAVAPPTQTLPPVTTPVSMLVHGQYPATVDVLSGDYDPSGGLLSVVGVTAPSRLQATIVDGQYLRVAATSPNPPATGIVEYQVSNGVSPTVTGQVTVYWAPPIQPAPPPVVPAVYATVRAGDEIDIPVLASASDPDGESVHLLGGGKPAAVTLTQTNAGGAYPTGLGSASASGSYVRYAAPAEGAAPKALTGPEQVTLAYVVESDSGARVTGQAYVTVNPTTPSLDTPPAPAEVDARTESGGTVTIDIPTTGVAPDGDSGTVTNIETPPHLGRVMSLTANSITYQAYPTAAGTTTFAGGTDSLTYDMVGPSGLSAQGLVRISVTPPTQVQAPVAVDHDVTAAPGETVNVDLLAGDIVAPGDQLTVEPLNTTNSTVPARAQLVGADHSTLQLVAPSSATPLSIAYGITDGTASPSVAHVVVSDEPGFALTPIASDYYPTAPASGAQTVKVDVLAKDSDPSGGNVVLLGSPDATVDPTSSSSLIIPVSAHPRSIPYEIESSTTKATAVGVVHLPGAATGPQLKPGQLIKVPAGGTTVVHVPDYITDPLHAIRLTTVDAQQASPSGGLSLQVDSNTDLTLKAAPGYSGPGSLTVQVIDAASLSAAGARTASFSIPVQVGTPSPIVRCPTDPLQVVESGLPVDADIAGICQVWTPTGASPNTLTYTEAWTKAIGGVNLGWAPGQTGKVVRVTAGSNAVGGAVGTITVGVQGSSPGGFSTLQVQAVEAGPATIAAINVPGVQTGSTATIDVAQYVTTPLSQPDITVISVGAASQGSAQVTHSGSQIQITPNKGVNGVVTFPVVVSDQGPQRQDRFIEGQITLQVLDNPGPPTGLTGVPGDKKVDLSWSPAPDNGSPIEYYTVAMNGVTVQTPGTSYSWTSGLQNGQTYQFTVTAVNRVGPGAQSVSGSFEPNSIPDAPTAVVAKAGDGQATVTWTAPFDGGKAIDKYIVSVSPSVGTSTQYVSGSATSFDWTGLSDTVGPYSFTVVAHNADGAGPSSSPSNSTYAHGTPPTPGAPTASGKVSPDQTTTTVTVTWPVITNCNDAQSCASYTVTELDAGAVAGTETIQSGQCSGSACTATFGPIDDNGAGYTYQVAATNQEGDVSATSPVSSPVVYAVGYPSQITDLAVSPGNTSVTATFTLPASHGASISRVDYYINGSGSASGSWSSPGQTGQKVTETIGGLNNGTSYSIQVLACSQSSGGTPGGCAPASNASAAIPFGPPKSPYINQGMVSNSGTSITVQYSWGGSYNGRTISYSYSVDGGPQQGGGSSNSEPNQVQETFPCNSGTHSFVVYANDSAGSTASSSSAQTAVHGCPQASISKGGATTTTYCTSADCAAIAITLSNFAPNTAYTIYFSTDCNPSNPTVYAACAGSPNPGTTNYVSETITTDGNGNYGNGDIRAFGYLGAKVWVNVGTPYPGGTQSNTVVW